MVLFRIRFQKAAKSRRKEENDATMDCARPRPLARMALSQDQRAAAPAAG